MKFTPPYWVQIKNPKTNEWIQGMVTDEEELKKIRKELVKNRAWFIISCSNTEDSPDQLLIGTGNTAPKTNKMGEEGLERLN